MFGIHSGMTTRSASAGLSAGLCPSFDGFAANWQSERRFEPRMDAATREHKWQGWREAVNRTLTRR